MQTRNLFRLDMAKDNDEFLALRRTRHVDHVYSGTPMKVGPGWIPDFLEPLIDHDSDTCRLTLIELEATEIAARASWRKYLPEPSSEIMRAFLGYLDTVISQCRSTADPRLDAFDGLKEIVVSTSTVVVHTAGALRTSPDLLEDLPLIDQPERRALAVVDVANRHRHSLSSENAASRAPRPTGFAAPPEFSTPSSLAATIAAAP
jgi:hypothetical protein